MHAKSERRVQATTATERPVSASCLILTRCSQEAQKSEVTLLDDDPDAVEAVLRHLYNFALEPSPPMCAETVKFYCNVVVAADKYDIHGLSEEA